ncbi:hypothetical protein CC86DRAFT_411509 [Ophiobolus disseminans]|uniref:Mid2 domain-containing protein n=1 Tax=Ophiobolus disseminans TaxID=1469910 RepID=A0A6A6ZLK6_9PLEO|nr:hypothetical protein CC86DRAFT_411509 [Ophiobolus disseminans]
MYIVGSLRQHLAVSDIMFQVESELISAQIQQAHNTGLLHCIATSYTNILKDQTSNSSAMSGLVSFDWPSTATPTTSIVTAQIHTLSRRAVASVTGVSQQTSQVKVTRTTVRMPASDATGVVFKMYKPAASKNTAPAGKSTAPAASSSSVGSNTTAIIGGITGVAVLVVALLVFCCIRRRRSNTRGKRSNAEMGKSHRLKDLSAKDVIDEAKRTRAERHQHHRQPTNQPYGWNAADTADLSHQNNVMAAENHLRSKRAGRGDEQSASSFGVDPSQLAQAQGWGTSFGADKFQSQPLHHPSRPARVPTKIKHGDARRPPPIVTQPVNSRRHQSHRVRPSKIPSPVSPGTDFSRSVYVPKGHTYDDVSPISSPHRSHGHAWGR